MINKKIKNYNSRIYNKIDVNKIRIQYYIAWDNLEGVKFKNKFHSIESKYGLSDYDCAQILRIKYIRNRMRKGIIINSNNIKF